MSSLEEEIKQPIFHSEIQKCYLNILYTSNWLRDRASVFFKPHGILLQHYNVLRIVRGRKGAPTSPGQIIEVMLDKGRDLTRLVDKLVKLGLLERRTCPTNRRKVDIFITDMGLEVTAIIEKDINEWHEKTLDITQEEAKQLNAILDKIRTRQQ